MHSSTHPSSRGGAEWELESNAASRKGDVALMWGRRWTAPLVVTKSSWMLVSDSLVPCIMSVEGATICTAALHICNVDSRPPAKRDLQMPVPGRKSIPLADERLPSRRCNN